MLRKKKRGVERENNKERDSDGGGSRARGRLMFESQFESHLWG